RWFVLNAEANVELDVTAAEGLQSLITELRRRGMVFGTARGTQDLRVVLRRGAVCPTARVKQDLRDVLTRAGLVDMIGEERMYMTLPTAVSAYREWGAAQP